LKGNPDVAIKALSPELIVLAVNIDDSHGGVVRITPTTADARALVDAGQHVSVHLPIANTPVEACDRSR